MQKIGKPLWFRQRGMPKVADKGWVGYRHGWLIWGSRMLPLLYWGASRFSASRQQSSGSFQLPHQHPVLSRRPSSKGVCPTDAEIGVYEYVYEYDIAPENLSVCPAAITHRTYTHTYSYTRIPYLHDARPPISDLRPLTSALRLLLSDLCPPTFCPASRTVPETGPGSGAAPTGMQKPGTPL